MLKANPAPCCGVTVGCCNRVLPEVLVATFADVSTCPCIAGMTVDLYWDPTFSGWIGTGPGGSCGLRSATFTLACSSGGTSCSNFTLAISGGVCVTVSSSLSAGCSCDPLNLVFNFSLSGIGCCDSMSGSGSITITISE